MRIRPEQSRVLVERIDDTKHGAIALPENIECPTYGRWRVVSVGSGRTLENGVVIEIPLKVGDEVVCDARFVAPLIPRNLFGNRDMGIVDYAGVQCTVYREPNEAEWTPTPSRILRPVLTH